MPVIKKSKYMKHVNQRQGKTGSDLKGNENHYGFLPKYKKEFVKLAFKFSLLGATLEQLGSFFDVNIGTISTWQNKYPDFGQAIRDGREVADAEVAHSMYKRALGVKVKEQKAHVVEGDIVITELEREIPAEVNAGKYWLTNRNKEKWGSTADVDVNVNVYKPQVKRFDGSVDPEDEEDVEVEVDVNKD